MVLTSMVPRRDDRLVKGKSIGKVVNQANGTTLWIDWVMSAVGFSLRVDRNKDKGR